MTFNVLTPLFKLYNFLVWVMQGLDSVTGQIDPTEKVAARDDAYTAGRCLLPRTWSLQLPNGVHRCNANLQHVALALKLLPTSSLLTWRSPMNAVRLYCIAGNFRQRKISSKRPSGSSSGIYFRQVPVFARLLFDRSVVTLLLIVYLPIHESISYSTLVVIEINLVKKLLWQKRQN